MHRDGGIEMRKPDQTVMGHIGFGFLKRLYVQLRTLRGRIILPIAVAPRFF